MRCSPAPTRRSIAPKRTDATAPKPWKPARRSPTSPIRPKALRRRQQALKRFAPFPRSLQRSRPRNDRFIGALGYAKGRYTKARYTKGRYTKGGPSGPPLFFATRTQLLRTQTKLAKPIWQNQSGKTNLDGTHQNPAQSYA